MSNQQESPFKTAEGTITELYRFSDQIEGWQSCLPLQMVALHKTLQLVQVIIEANANCVENAAKP